MAHRSHTIDSPSCIRKSELSDSLNQKEEHSKDDQDIEVCPSGPNNANTSRERRRTLLLSRISGSPFDDEILIEANSRVRSSVVLERPNMNEIINYSSESLLESSESDNSNSSTEKVVESPKNSVIPRCKAIDNSLANLELSDEIKNKLVNLDDVAQELLLGILSGNINYVESYISIFESKDCKTIQNIIAQMSSKS